tara:strand:+ start:262 stop:444 length:183 start_codon:yes stop_codon:yes gene_type:complete
LISKKARSFERVFFARWMQYANALAAISARKNSLNRNVSKQLYQVIEYWVSFALRLAVHL